MKLFRLVPFGLLLCAFAIATPTEAGTGVRNGGTYYRCTVNDRDQDVMAEHLLAMRGIPIRRIEDRDAFFADILRKIENPTFRRLLVERWNAYGDSATWPEGDLSRVEVFSYYPAREPQLYGPDGTLPANEPRNALCSFPAYEPDLCCTKVLASYFSHEDAQPQIVLRNFQHLDRYQRNVLELHEAVYRLAFDLGQLPPLPASYRKDLDAYLASPWQTGEIPADLVEGTIIPLLARNSSGYSSDFHYALERFWLWSHAIYGGRADAR